MIPIYKPYLPDYILKYVHDAIDSKWVSSNGEYLLKVREILQDKLKIKNILMVNNGTSAVHIVAKSLNFKFPNISTVTVPNNVYVAAWNAFLFDKTFSLVPIDADINTWNFNIEKLKNPEAVLIVHNLGNIINVPLLKIKFPKSVFVEDNCEGFMGKYEGKYSGAESLCSAISFFGNKNITSGEGGAFCTNDDDLFDFANSIHGQGQSKKRYIHERMGYNYRMTNIQASLLYGQLIYLEEILERKKNVFNRYKNKFKDTPKVIIQQVDKNTIHSNWMMGIRIDGNPSYEKIYSFLNAKGIETRPIFYPMSYHKHLKKYSNIDDEKIASLLSLECLMLPSYPELMEEEIDYIVKNVNIYIRDYIHV